MRRGLLLCEHYLTLCPSRRDTPSRLSPIINKQLQSIVLVLPPLTHLTTLEPP